MTLYTQAESNTRKTWFLIFGFLIFIIVLGWLFSYLLDSYAILVIAVFIAIFMSFGSYWYSDKIVLKMTRASLVDKKDNPELYRIVENLCITAGLPLPRIYIIEEKQPNAFATGRDAKHAVVAVTRGLLEKLKRTSVLHNICNKKELRQISVIESHISKVCITKAVLSVFSGIETIS